MFYGDGHFDHYKTDVEGLVSDLKKIGEQENVFMVFNGDVGDWGDVRFKGYSMPSVVLPIQIRYKIIHYLFDQIPNLLAMVAGCHDDWLKNRAYFDITESIVEKRNELGLPTYYLGYGGTLNFKVGKATYRIAIHHKLLGSSRFNMFHGCIRYLQENDPTADIVAEAHRHDKCGVTHQYFHHVPRVLIRSGSRQYLTDYAWKSGFAGAIAKAPMVLLNGEKKEMRAMPDYNAGMDELKRLNK